MSGRQGTLFLPFRRISGESILGLQTTIIRSFRRVAGTKRALLARSLVRAREPAHGESPPWRSLGGCPGCRRLQKCVEADWFHREDWRRRALRFAESPSSSRCKHGPHCSLGWARQHHSHKPSPDGWFDQARPGAICSWGLSVARRTFCTVSSNALTGKGFDSVAAS